MKVKLTLAYDGSAFMGSQVQTTTAQTVMGTLERTLRNLGIQEPPVASGRTDRDVHATRQVAHLSLPPFWRDLFKLRALLNQHLPSSLHVRRIDTVDEDFHARYGARRRSYRYILSTQTPNPFEARFVTFVPTFDPLRVREAMRLFEGEHDFTHFMKTGSDTQSAVRSIYKTRCYSHKGYHVLLFEGNGFLRSQIRLMVGFLLQISEGTLTPQMLHEQLTCKQVYTRALAPAQGLYLCRIGY